MPRTVETVVYELEELSEAAKESARAWYRETCLEHEWYDAVFEDFETICRILGVTLRTSPVKLMGGGTRENPHLFFAGSPARATGPRSRASTAMPGARPGPSAPTRRRTRSCTASRTSCRRSRSATSIN